MVCTYLRVVGIPAKATEMITLVDITLMGSPAPAVNARICKWKMRISEVTCLF